MSFPQAAASFSAYPAAMIGSSRGSREMPAVQCSPPQAARDLCFSSLLLLSPCWMQGCFSHFVLILLLLAAAQLHFSLLTLFISRCHQSGWGVHTCPAMVPLELARTGHVRATWPLLTEVTYQPAPLLCTPSTTTKVHQDLLSLWDIFEDTWIQKYKH